MSKEDNMRSTMEVTTETSVQEKSENSIEEINKKKLEVDNLYDELTNKLKESLDLFPKPPGRLMRAWLWFQKHAFTSVIFIVLGISLGIGIEKIQNYNQMIKAINLQRFEFKGDIFEISPSSIKKYYIGGEKNLTSILPTPKPKVEETIK